MNIIQKIVKIIQEFCKKQTPPTEGVAIGDDPYINGAGSPSPIPQSNSIKKEESPAINKRISEPDRGDV